MRATRLGCGRVAVALACCVGLLGVDTGAAGAVETRVIHDGTAGNVPDSMINARIAVVAAAGQVNDLEVYVPQGLPEGVRQVAIVDEAAGVRTMSSFCTQVSPIEVRCDASGLRELVVRARDGDDSITCVNDGGGPTSSELAPPIDFTIDAGSGADVLDVVPTCIFGGNYRDGDLAGRWITDGGDDRIVLGLRPRDLSTAADIRVDTGEGDDNLWAGPRGDAIVQDVFLKIVATLGAGNDTAAIDNPDVSNPDITNPDLIGVGGAAGSDAIAVSGSGVARGGEGSDTLTGGAGDQRLFGEAGDDRINGGDGEDFCHGGIGTNTIAADCEKTVSP